MKRIILDTNITISAFFWGGHPRAIINLVKEEKIMLLTSLQIEAEFIRVLSYVKFGLLPAEIIPIVNNLRRYTVFVEVKSKINVIKQDPTDNIFIECAFDGNADYIISGDSHLLDIGDYKNIQIIRAKDFLTKERFIKE
ncbi:MAG: putative toxin-antitoxin system toxin component, PIN family [Elusimicrobiota bacterium]